LQLSLATGLGDLWLLAFGFLLLAVVLPTGTGIGCYGCSLPTGTADWYWLLWLLAAAARRWLLLLLPTDTGC